MVFHGIHDCPAAGHNSMNTTEELIGRYYWWPTLQKDVRDYVGSCEMCARCKPSRHKKFGALRPLPIPQGPWQCISMDFVGPLPESKDCNKILIVKCRYTKECEVIEVRNDISAPALGKKFIKEVFARHGLPTDIISDRGSVFLSKFWRAVCKALHIKGKHSTAFHPQTNGGNERVNQTFYEYIRMFCDYLQEDWVDWLPLLKFKMNNMVSSSTGVTPFYANHGYHPCMDFDIIPNTKLLAVNSFMNRFSLIWKGLTEFAVQAQKRMKFYGDRKRKPVSDTMFATGDRVWLSARNFRTKRPSKKLDYVHFGPFIIEKKLTPSVVRLKLPKGYKIHRVVNIDLLKPYKPNPFPNRIIKPPLPAVLVDGEEEYFVDKILDVKKVHKHYEYLVRWLNYSVDHDSWEPVANVVNAPDAVRKFHQQFPNKPIPPDVERALSRKAAAYNCDMRVPRKRKAPLTAVLPVVSHTPAPSVLAVHTPTGDTSPSTPATGFTRKSTRIRYPKLRV